MTPVRDIYNEYKIMPSLATHQFRVAAVAFFILDALKENEFAVALHRDEVISACLSHDMGNILKFDLSYFPEFLVPKGLAYWEGVKADYEGRYGAEEHAATLQIAEEIGVSALTREYIGAVGFENALKTAQSGSVEKMVCCYADQRVAPRGVVSLLDRWKEGADRYAGRSMRVKDEAYAARQIAALLEMEKNIFARTVVAPDAITDAACEKYFPTLEAFSLV